ncbi:ferritin-like domain-containing protein [Yinghuangia seranimata]|uniref:ferritin-like domain-containing protein n=1 Tax=Yinghuangia seranimata TaxID=408067 RepID=UPI00248C7C63|nr:ferritin-like domain-containing protein [Yinghuangia seranimata]MDI2132780.1 ferritin-like domain-containing protein [Yinghuangia seranimata]
MTTPVPPPAAPSPSASRKETPLVASLQTLLDAEHAAVYGYGVVGARSDGPTQAQARTSYDAHRARRDELEQRIAKEGGQPRAAAPAYTLPFPVETQADATRLAVVLEEGIAAHIADLVAAASGDARVAAAKWLQEAAIAAVPWRGASVAFPGLPEKAAGGGAPGTPTGVS